MAYKVLTLFTVGLNGSLTNANSVSGKIFSAIGSSPNDVQFADLGGYATIGPSLTYYVTPNRLSNQSQGSRANYVTGSTAFLPAVRFTFEWTYVQQTAASTGAASSEREVLFGVDPAITQNGQTCYKFGHIQGVGWRLRRQLAGVSNGDGTYQAPTPVDLQTLGPTILPVGSYSLMFLLDPSGYYEAWKDGALFMSGVDPSPISVAGKRIGMWVNNGTVTTNSTNYGFGGPMVLKSYTPKTGGGSGVDAGARTPAPARAAAPLRQTA